MGSPINKKFFKNPRHLCTHTHTLTSTHSHSHTRPKLVGCWKRKEGGLTSSAYSHAPEHPSPQGPEKLVTRRGTGGSRKGLQPCTLPSCKRGGLDPRKSQGHRRKRSPGEGAGREPSGNGRRRPLTFSVLLVILLIVQMLQILIFLCHAKAG